MAPGPGTSETRRMTKTSSWHRVLSPAALTVLVAGFALRPQVLAADQPLAVVLGRWTTAVMHHTPSTSDAAVAAIWAMTPADQEVIRGHLPLFLTFLDGADFSHAKGDVLAVAAAASSLRPLGRAELEARRVCSVNRSRSRQRIETGMARDAMSPFGVRTSSSST